MWKVLDHLFDVAILSFILVCLINGWMELRSVVIALLVLSILGALAKAFNAFLQPIIEALQSDI